MSFAVGFGVGLQFAGRAGATEPPTGLWLLLTGNWSDPGQWVDSETWNDGA